MEKLKPLKSKSKQKINTTVTKALLLIFIQMESK
jgi:hypothetical protein